MFVEVCLLTEVGKSSTHRVDLDSPGPGELLVNVLATGICGSDLAAFRGTHPYKRAPAVLGHEFSGIVKAIGSGVTLVKPGDLVCSSAYSSCDDCDECLAGHTNLCPNKRSLSHDGWMGTFAEAVILRENMTHVVPSHVDPIDVALVEPLSIARHALRLVEPIEGRRVVVLGAGSIGLCVIIIARAQGAHEVVAVDLGPTKAGLAERAGASAFIDARKLEDVDFRTPADGADIVVIAAGYTGVVDQAIRLLRPGGSIVIVSYFDNSVVVPLNALVGLEAKIYFSALSVAEDFQDVIRWIDTGILKPASVVTHEFALRNAHRAFETMMNSPQEVGKIILRPEQNWNP